MKIWILGIFTFFFNTGLYATNAPQWSIESVLWNKQVQTLDLVLKVDPYTQANIFSNYKKLHVSVDGDSSLSFKIHSIHLGKVNDLSMIANLPPKVFVLIDKGNASNYVPILEQKASKIIQTYSPKFIVDLAYFSNQASMVEPVIRYDFNTQKNVLKDQVPNDRVSHYANVFLQLKPFFRQYEKIFLLTDGVPASSSSFKMLNQSWLLDNNIFGSAQIIPVGNEGILHASFFEFIEGLNAFRLSRDNYSQIPPPNLDPSKPALDSIQLTIRYKLTTPRPWIDASTKLKLSFEGKDGAHHSITKSSILTNIFDPVLNNQFFTENDPIWTIILIGLLLSLLLYYFIPMYNRYVLKKHHVKTYGEIKDSTPAIDPLKLSPIQDLDKVVVFDDKVMLLDSWKFINKSEEPIRSVSAYSSFFKPAIIGDIFSQDQGIFKYLLPGFLSVVLSFLFTFLYYLISNDLLIKWSAVEHAITLPFPLSEIEIIKPTLLLTILLIGLSAIYQFVIHRSWPSNKSVGILLGILLLSVVIFEIIYALSFHYLPDGLSIIIAHIILTTIIVLSTKFQWRFPGFTYLVREVGFLALLSLFAFYIIPVYGLSLNVEASIGIIICSLIFCLGFCIWMGNDIKSLSNWYLEPSHPDQDSETHNISELANGSKKLIIGNSQTADIHLSGEDAQIKGCHASINKKLHNFKIQPEEGQVFVNDKPIFQAKTLSKGDLIAFNGKDVEFIVR